MARMTTQQRLDCPLKTFDALANHQGDEVVLNEHDFRVLMKQCVFANHHEISFFINALDELRLVTSGCSADNTVIGATITIDGYCHLDTLNHR